MSMKNYHRFNNHLSPMQMFQAFIKSFQGKQEQRFADQPAWVKAEMLDKAAAKRKMRAEKRVKAL